MNCGFPVAVGERYRPCGKCQACLRRRRNAWTGRMLLEQSQHSECAFVTLTYNEETMPLVYLAEHDIWIPTLVKSHLQRFIKSVRKKAMRLERRLRYFAAGEYGSKTGRPHYHLILFGTGPCWNPIYEASWNRGFVSSYDANPRSMSYVAKYCLKGGKDPELGLPEYGEYSLENARVTVPPFRLTSRNPAIGATFAPNIADSLKITMDAMGPCGLAERGKSATTVRIDGKKYPLDRTMKSWIGKGLEARGLEAEQCDAILKPDFGDPTDEEIEKGRQTHLKALTQRHSRTKL